MAAEFFGACTIAQGNYQCAHDPPRNGTNHVHGEYYSNKFVTDSATQSSWLPGNSKPVANDHWIHLEWDKKETSRYPPLTAFGLFAEEARVALNHADFGHATKTWVGWAAKLQDGNIWLNRNQRADVTVSFLDKGNVLQRSMKAAAEIFYMTRDPPFWKALKE